MKNLIQRFIREEAGQDLIEYALLAAFLAITAISAMTYLSGQDQRRVHQGRQRAVVGSVSLGGIRTRSTAPDAFETNGMVFGSRASSPIATAQRATWRSRLNRRVRGAHGVWGTAKTPRRR